MPSLSSMSSQSTRTQLSWPQSQPQRGPGAPATPATPRSQSQSQGQGQSQSQGQRRGGRETGSQNYMAADKEVLLNTIEEVLPKSADGWAEVVRIYNEYAAANGRLTRNEDSLRKKWSTMIHCPKPTGDPMCPPEVRRAKRIYRKICEDIDTTNPDDEELLGELDHTEEPERVEDNNDIGEDNVEDQIQSQLGAQASRSSSIPARFKSSTPVQVLGSCEPSRDRAVQRRSSQATPVNALMSYFSPEELQRRDQQRQLDNLLIQAREEIRELQKEIRQVERQYSGQLRDMERRHGREILEMERRHAQEISDLKRALDMANLELKLSTRGQKGKRRRYDDNSSDSESRERTRERGRGSDGE